MNLKLDNARRVVGQNYADGQSRDDWSDEQTYELLANARRRECVRHLENHSGERVAVRDLADAVADALAEDGPASESLCQSVYTSLSQHHLDKLDGCDVVDYDQEAKSVSTGSNFEMVTCVSADPNSGSREIGAVSSLTSALTVATLLVAAVAYPQLATAPVIGVAALNLLPVGLFLQTRFDGDR